MLKIFDSNTIKELDRFTIAHEPVSEIDLVERAATAFVHEYSRHFSKQNRVIVFSGQGNNGADSLAVARLLDEEGFRVEAYLFNPTQQLSAECEQNKQRLVTEKRVRLLEIFEDFEPPVLTSRDILIDGLFGSGLNRPLSGGYTAVVDYVNQSAATVVAIDMPSGLFSEDNRYNNPRSIIRANWTFTFEFPKLAFMLAENEIFLGKWKILPIGIHPAVIRQTDTPYQMVTDEDLTGLLRPRNVFSHKGDFGHALLIVGGSGKMGAAVLAAQACLRSGVGQLTVHLPARGEVVLQTSTPEAMLSIDVNESFVSKLPDDLDRFAAVGVGPGIGTASETAALLEQLIMSVKKPLVLDADALNILALHPEWIEKLPQQTLLTPHPKEFDRMFGACTSAYERLHKASNAAVKYKICILLKGAYSATCSAEGYIYFNSTGNPGMATSGSGDVLTGIATSLLAQGFSTETAAVTAAYLHGSAGDLACNEFSAECMIASDIIRKLGKAFKLQKDDELI